MEDGEFKSEYVILERISKDNKPLLEREFIENIPREEIEYLINVFLEYGTIVELGEGPYRN